MIQRRQRSLKLFVGTMLGLVVLGATQGCGPPPIERLTNAPIEGYEETLERIREDPVVFLRESYAAARKLDSFSTGFTRQERLGILGGQLKPIEHMIAEYRADPLSIRFTWTDEDSEYLQAVYVDGKNDSKVRLLPRYGMFGLPGSAQDFPPHWAVLFNKSKFPIMDFGPKRLMQKTLARIEAAEEFGGVKIAVSDATEIGDTKESCFHFELRYPKDDAFKPKLQDLYIHTDTKLPVATFLWLPNGGDLERTGATLDAMYQYTGLDPAAPISDETFVIDANKKKEENKGEKKEQKEKQDKG